MKDNKNLFAKKVKAIGITRNHTYLVYFGSLGWDRNPNGVSVNNLPLNSDSFTEPNKFIKDENTASMSGGLILMNIIPLYSSGGNNRILPRCLSNDNITLPSDLASLATSSSSERKEAFFTSKPSFSSSLTTLSGTFSSEYNFGLLEDDILFLFNQLGGVINGRENRFLSEPREVVPDDFIWRYTGSKQIEDLPDHYSGIFENRNTVADFAVDYNVLVDFDSHGYYDGKAVYKCFENQRFSKLRKFSISAGFALDWDELIDQKISVGGIEKINGSVIIRLG